MTTAFTISQLYRDVQTTLEDLQFLASDEAHAEGELAAVEFVSVSRGEDSCDLVFELRPYSLAASVSDEDQQIYREVLDELSSHRDPRVRAAARRERADTPTVAPEDLDGIELSLFCDEEEEPRCTVNTNRRRRTVFRGVPARAWCRVQMRLPPMPAPPPTRFHLPAILEIGIGCVSAPAAADAGDAQAPQTDPLPVRGELPCTDGCLVWQVYRDDADRIVLGLRYGCSGAGIPASVTVDVTITEDQTQQDVLLEAVELERDHQGI